MSNLLLTPHKCLPRRKLLIVVMDGLGIGPEDEYDAVHMASTPFMDAQRQDSRRFRSVRAHGTAVGLPTDADMGNSEVGHNALGAGRVALQGASLVDDALKSGEIYTGEGYRYLLGAFTKEGSTLHLIGLLSDGGVHSRDNQIYSIIEHAAKNGAKRVRVHVLYDGRDVPDGSSFRFTEELEAVLAKVRQDGCDAAIASGGGRMFVTMDRYDADWSIVERGWKAQVLGDARHFHSAKEAITTFREEDPKVTDQYYPPFVVVDEQDKPLGTIEDGDAVLCVNFRGDRVIEMTRAFEDDDFDKFDRVRVPKVRYAGMMRYDGDLGIPNNFLVPPPKLTRVSEEYLCGTGLKIFACSETQKFGHVTYFWNGNRSGKIDEDHETFKEVPSDRVHFNEQPKMKSAEITEAAIEALKSGMYDVVRINFPNGDMVGHTGDLKATIAGVEAVDKSLAKLKDAVDSINGVFIVTADHGNSDDMAQRDKKGRPIKDEKGNVLPLTSHTLSPVPVFIGGAGLDPRVAMRTDLPAAGLANVTATFINLLGFEAPEDYEPSLIYVEN
ncbi:2 [Leishmania donovani]|uniref:phosphoglycerate mutase (2,3-diphosphoglycerate-independent) n=3 Tax=Leishmania donovani species complex TaxID=38574 RepID=A0A6L0XTF3_LEIIN|nr:2,3-bisphosphoglycerate-independent phosphoglycerate mutase [Leishmania infantum JPCM5]CAC9553384.1 2_-3-bisphosphoglycerate-independent_phosphoglycerate_mutase [Leishmania infantum]CAJ1994082.1 2 [Leishmania donovani] [Leishmania donovani]CBZ09057.1 2,3-bisphosphoglycerate-independent phosphoglycerate mutase [Leishmania infantum JPCM5]SUZ47087.1 2_-3-bisphosphoglycerate-independent_phosphoglycerate_mutase [Leishmania infantum]VDZ49901.1 23-bisphosphoglycerate-independent_phosphoglycerate_m|eukprot:XP_003392848.1 2,3-bisphosphoglycerate-independent phosphoglycerate mutase [Leishmania infantum JPCM5]